MARYLVVADQTLGGAELQEQIRQQLADDASFYVLVPETPPDDAPAAPQYALNPASAGPGHGVAPTLVDDAERRADDESHRATLQAQARLAQAVDMIRSQGGEVDGRLGGPDPLPDIEQLVETDRFDEIIVSTQPAGISRWLGLDLPGRIERKFGIPVTTVTAAE